MSDTTNEPIAPGPDDDVTPAEPSVPPTEPMPVAEAAEAAQAGEAAAPPIASPVPPAVPPAEGFAPAAPAPPMPAKTGHKAGSKLWPYIVGGVVLGLILIAAAFGTGVAVGGHAGRFGGRNVRIERGLQNGGMPYGTPRGPGQYNGRDGNGYGRGNGYHNWQRSKVPTQPSTPTQ